MAPEFKIHFEPVEFALPRSSIKLTWGSAWEIRTIWPVFLLGRAFVPPIDSEFLQ